MIGIVAALPEELSVLKQRLSGARRRSVGGLEASAGRLRDREACLMVTGEGMRLAAAGADALLAESSLAALVGIGVAGGLSEGLAPGDLVLARRVLAPDGEAFEPPAGPWSERQGSSSLVSGTVVTVDAIAAKARDKRRLAERLRLEPPAVVDLESAAWARAAQGRSLPWSIVRAVSDTIDEDLPLDFERFRKEDGSISRSRLVAHAVVRPALMLELDRLRRRVNRCAERLADAVEELIGC